MNRLGSFVVVTSVLFGSSYAQYEDDAFDIVGDNRNEEQVKKCKISISETLPVGMIYNNPDYDKHISTLDAWLKLINGAQHSLYIVAFYWTLTNTDSLPLDVRNNFTGLSEGIKIWNAIRDAGLRNVSVKIVQNAPSNSHRCEDSLRLAHLGLAEVRNVYMNKYLGSGVLHTKFIIVDDSAFYLGSANMDWRALTDVKELGLLVQECHELTHDLLRIFHVYWGLGVVNAVFPNVWPPEYDTRYNEIYPLKVFTNHFEPAFVFLASSPPKFCPPGRTTDLQAIIHVLRKAKRFAFISVMSFKPIRMYTTPIKYWGVIDSTIRAAAFERKLEVKVLTSKWKYFKDTSYHFQRSLMALSGIHPRVKITCKEFEVPSNEKQNAIPYARVNHAKFVVTDNSVYVGTSNWIGNYFIDTAGVSMIIEGKTAVRQHLENIFMRDWNSQFATYIPKQSEEKVELNITGYNSTFRGGGFSYNYNNRKPRFGSYPKRGQFFRRGRSSYRGGGGGGGAAFGNHYGNQYQRGQFQEQNQYAPNQNMHTQYDNQYAPNQNAQYDNQYAPHQNMHAQNENVHPPKQNVHAPDQNDAPDQNANDPYQQQTAPDQQNTAPDQQDNAPNQQDTTPNQQYTAPDQQDTVPDQQDNAPDQQYTAPDQQDTAKDHQADAPDQNVHAADQETNIPVQNPEVPDQDANQANDNPNDNTDTFNNL